MNKFMIIQFEKPQPKTNVPLCGGGQGRCFANGAQIFVHQPLFNTTGVKIMPAI